MFVQSSLVCIVSLNIGYFHEKQISYILNQVSGANLGLRGL